MAKNKGVARAAKDRRRADAEERNAATPAARRRVERDGDPATRERRPVPVAALSDSATAVVEAPKVKRGIVLAAKRTRGGVAQPSALETERDPGHRRLIAYWQRTRPAGAPRTRPSDVAPRRLGDGIKPNHAVRAVAIGSVFAAAPAVVETAVAVDEAAVA